MKAVVCAILLGLVLLGAPAGAQNSTANSSGACSFPSFWEWRWSYLILNLTLYYYRQPAYPKWSSNTASCPEQWWLSPRSGREQGKRQRSRHKPPLPHRKWQWKVSCCKCIGLPQHVLAPRKYSNIISAPQLHRASYSVCIAFPWRYQQSYASSFGCK